MTFSLVCLAWIFFRANHLSDAFYIITHLFSGWGEFLKNIHHLSQGQNILGLGPIGRNKFIYLYLAALIILLELVHVLHQKIVPLRTKVHAPVIVHLEDGIRRRVIGLDCFLFGFKRPPGIRKLGRNFIVRIGSFELERIFLQMTVNLTRFQNGRQEK